MKLVYTEQALQGLEEALDFLANKVSPEKLIEIRNRILDKADTLLLGSFDCQEEPYLNHLNKGHRRLVEGHYKIVYRKEGQYIYITDIFDSRQDPEKMRG